MKYMSIYIGRIFGLEINDENQYCSLISCEKASAEFLPYEPFEWMFRDT